MTIWLDGKLRPSGAAAIDAADRGFTLGDGLFETIRATDGAALRLERHLKRLRAGAALLSIPVPFDDAALAQAICDLLHADGLAQAAVRLTLTRGPAPRGVLPPADPKPTLLLTAGALPLPTGPASMITATVTRRNELSPLAGIKSLNYLDNVIARQEAARRQADDALLLNTQGRVAESTIANLFVRLDGALVTPPATEGALPGVMRAVLLEAGAVERTLLPDDLRRAEGAFLSNSLELRAIASIDGEAVGDSLGLVARALGG